MSSEREIRDKNICAAVSIREKKAFGAFCAEKKLKPSQMLRLMLHRVCPEDISPGEQQLENEDEKNCLLLRVGKKDLKLIREKARGEAITAQEWIRRRLRAVIHRTHQFNKQEENALRESNRELANLGRNINQIAHQLNSLNLTAIEQLNVKRLETIENEIQKHRAVVTRLLNANWGRFGDGEDEVSL